MAPRSLKPAYLLLLVACGEPPLSPNVAWIPITGSTIVQSNLSDFSASTRLVVGDTGTWRTIWPKLHGVPTPPVPRVDFANTTILLAALGGRGTGGYSITIDSIARQDGRLLVHVTEVSPGRSCGVTEAITLPVHVFLLFEPVATVDWKASARELRC